MRLIAIKTKDRVYISENVENKSYYNNYNSLLHLFFDGKNPVPTFRNDWFEITGLPAMVEKKNPDKQINVRWELKSGFPVSDLTPAVIEENPLDEESQYHEVQGLYSKKFETEPGGFEKIDIELSIIAEQDGFRIIKQDFPVQNSILDSITYNPVLLQERPCKLSPDEFYRIIRAHIKANINAQYATISSDYDFCLTVQKILELHKPQQYRIDTGTKRRPNIQVRYNQTKKITVYECAPKAYQGYTVLQPLIGETYEDLQQKVNTYLDDIMQKINEPICECPTCFGAGAIIKTINQ